MKNSINPKKTTRNSQAFIKLINKPNFPRKKSFQVKNDIIKLIITNNKKILYICEN